MIVMASLLLAALVRLGASTEESELDIGEEGTEDYKASHVGVEGAWHTVHLSILDQIDNLELPWESTSIKGDASDNCVCSSERGSEDDDVPENDEGKASKDSTHQHDEDPEDNLAIGVNLVHECVVKNEAKSDSAPASSHCGSYFREIG